MHPMRPQKKANNLVYFSKGHMPRPGHDRSCRARTNQRSRCAEHGGGRTIPPNSAKPMNLSRGILRFASLSASTSSSSSFYCNFLQHAAITTRTCKHSLFSGPLPQNHPLHPREWCPCGILQSMQAVISRSMSPLSQMLRCNRT